MTNGEFYLKKTANGNLVGEWFNDSTPGTFTESCDLDGSPKQSFDGTYFSTWREGTEAFIARLEIRPKQDNEFTLLWHGLNANFRFEGHGTLQFDGILRGDYHSI